MERMPQTYANHTKFVPIYHFFAFPMIGITMLWAGYRLYTNGITADSAIDFLFKVALVIAALFARVFALKAQDRVIRLEERLRIARVLAPEAQAKSAALTPAQLIALRFASDAELPSLIDKTLAGNWAGDDIKKAIVHWQADYHRV